MLLTQAWASLLLKEPKVPKFQPVDVQKEQAKAIEGNLAQFPNVEALGMKLAEFSKKAMETTMPGTSGIMSETARQISSALKGELPADVMSQISRRAAERGISSGTAGSQFAKFGELQTLGLNSLQRIQQGLSSAQQWIQMAQGTVPNLGSMMVTPEFQAQFAAQERNAKFQRNWVANQIAAQYDPMNRFAQGVMVEDQQITQLASSVLGAVAGKAMGCDVNTKTDIEKIDIDAVVKKLEEVEVYSWRYKTENEDVRHLGPMAQDFRKAFGLGDTELRIQYMDAIGVLMACVKALASRVKALEESPNVSVAEFNQSFD